MAQVLTIKNYFNINDQANKKTKKIKQKNILRTNLNHAFNSAKLLKLYKQIDDFAELKDYTKLLFENYSSKLIKNIGFSEFDDNFLVEFKKFFSYDLEKKIKPINKELVLFDDLQIFINNVIKNDFNFNYSKNKFESKSNIINRLIKTTEAIFTSNQIMTYFRNLYTSNDFSEKCKIKINKILCLNCDKFKMYFLEINHNAEDKSFNNIHIIQMKNYKQDLILLENKNIYFIDKINNKLKIIYKNHFNFENEKNIVINVKNTLKNNFVNVMDIKKNVRTISLISNDLTKNFILSNNKFICDIYKNNYIDVINRHISRLFCFHCSIAKNHVVLEHVYSNNILIESFDPDNLDSSNEFNKNIVLYDLKNNMFEHRKSKPIIFTNSLELVNHSLNPLKLFDQYELIGKINFNPNIFMDIDMNNLTNKAIETKPNLTLIILETNEFYIDIIIANIDLLYSVSKYNKIHNTYQYFTNDNEFTILTFSQILNTFDSNVFPLNILYDKKNNNLFDEFDGFENISIGNNKHSFTPYKLNLNNEQKKNLIEKNTINRLNDCHKLLYETNYSVKYIKEMFDCDYKSSEKKIGLYFEHLFLDSVNYLQIISEKIINKSGLTIEYMLDIMFGIEQMYNKINIVDLVNSILNLNFNINECSIIQRCDLNIFNLLNVNQCDFLEKLFDSSSSTDMEKSIYYGFIENNLILNVNYDNNLIQIICSNIFENVSTKFNKNQFNKPNDYNPKTISMMRVDINNVSNEINYKISQKGIFNQEHYNKFIQQMISNCVDKYSEHFENSKFLELSEAQENKLTSTNIYHIIKKINCDTNDVGIVFDFNKTKTINFISCSYINDLINKLKQKLVEMCYCSHEFNISNKFIQNYLTMLIENTHNNNKFSFAIGNKFFKQFNFDIKDCSVESLDKSNDTIVLRLMGNKPEHFTLIINMLGLGSFFDWITGNTNSTNTNKLVPANTISHLKTNNSTSININGEDMFEQSGSKILTKKIRVGLIEDKPQYVWKICHVKNINNDNILTKLIDPTKLINPTKSIIPTKCLVKLELEEDSQYIIPSDSTHYFSGKNRCDKAKVVGIYDLSQEEKEYPYYTIAVPAFTSTYLEYKKNSVVYADSFDTNISHTCSNGIHVFETKEQAINLGLGSSNEKNISIQLNNIISQSQSQSKQIIESNNIKSTENQQNFKNKQEPEKQVELNNLFDDELEMVEITKSKQKSKGKINIVNDETGALISTNQNLNIIDNFDNKNEESVNLESIILENKNNVMNNDVINNDDNDYAENDFLIPKQGYGLRNRKYNY